MKSNKEFVPVEKVARLCWNTLGWRRPSGRKGKSKERGTYENDKGFGHEEWLLDETKTMPDGYLYGFLEQMRRTDRHIGNIYDIHLYTISPNSQRVYLGCLKNAVGVSHEESEEVYKYYQKKGWITDMKQDIAYAEGVVSDFNPSTMFNVKFIYEDAELYHSNYPIIKPESIGHRYNLMDMTDPFEFEKDENGNIKILDVNVFERETKAGKILIDPLHKKIQNAVAEILKSQYSKLYVEMNPNGLSEQRVDIQGFSNKEKEWHYFEVKTVSAKRCIREALGQILEYAHYPNDERAKKFFIIGPEPPDETDKAYMKLIRKKYSIPIWFRWYSFKENKLYEGV